jgi:hypothetical protein
MRGHRILLATLLSLLALGLPHGAAEKPILVSSYIAGPIPLDVSAPAWGRAKAAEISLLAQVIAKPFNFVPSITRLAVKSLHNGSVIAFLVTWEDATKDVTMYTDKFRDAVAVQIPVAGATDITMGKPGGRVLILHWKADWQEDIDKTFQDVAHLYPNAWSDWYPFAVGEPPYDINAWTNPEARRYMTGWVLGNPRSQPEKRTSVEEQIAEGFGSLTTSERQGAVGRGVHGNGEWQVVIVRPFTTGDPNDPSWGPGTEVPVAFAAWDGGKGEIGSKKSFSDWVTVKVAPIGR